MIVTEQVILKAQHCITCGVLFAFPQKLNDALITNGATFYCPNGHPAWYGASEADRLRTQLEAEKKFKLNAQRRAEMAEASEQRAITAQGIAAKKLKAAAKRAGAGVCPHCPRTFVSLTRHIKSKHPEMVVLEPRSEAARKEKKHD